VQGEDENVLDIDWADFLSRDHYAMSTIKCIVEAEKIAHYREAIEVIAGDTGVEFLPLDLKFICLRPLLTKFL